MSQNHNLDYFMSTGEQLVLVVYVVDVEEYLWPVGWPSSGLSTVTDMVV